MDSKGQIIQRPQGMDDEAWAAHLKERGLVSLSIRDGSHEGGLNRHKRRRMMTLARRGK